MPVLDAQGREVRSVTDEALVKAINTLGQRTENQQYQIMQLGLLVEYLVEQLTNTSIPDPHQSKLDRQEEGTRFLPLLVMDENDFKEWQEKRFAEIKEQSRRLVELAQQAPQNLSFDLEE